MAITNASRLADFGSGIGTQGAIIQVDNAGQEVGIGTTNPNATLTVGAVGASGTSLFVHGDARIVGILSVGQGTITLDPNAKTLTGLDELKIGSGTTAITIKKSVTTGEIEFADQEGQESSIGIGTTVSINTTGIVTATTFSGNLPTTDLTGTITNAQLAGSIANAKLANDSVSFGGVSVDLGASDATPAFDLSDATAYPYNSLTGITTEIVGDTTPQLGGNLDLNSKYITGTGGINAIGIVTATQFISNSTTTAFYPPVLTTTQRDAMSGLSQGAMIFNSTSKKMEFYDGTTWQSLPGMSLGLTVALDG